MRGITTSLAVLLSLLLVSVPVSTWTCEVHCSLRQAHSDCHTSATASKDDTAMSMPPGMDMGSDHSESPMGPDSVMKAISGHSMSMSPQQTMTTERFEHATKPAIETGTVHGHPRSVPSCTHGTCSQVLASASPPGADHSQPNSLHRVAITISSPVNFWITLHWIGSGTPPPKPLGGDRLVTTLRI
jgi:hypothetical protein